ncbi:MAG: hypothetical protein IJ617_08640 [Oscillospiraceae bacterium]|nr:hypothetical protein [Oscillospiraceae bacterium]
MPYLTAMAPPQAGPLLSTGAPAKAMRRHENDKLCINCEFSVDFNLTKAYNVYASDNRAPRGFYVLSGKEASVFQRIPNPSREKM